MCQTLLTITGKQLGDPERSDVDNSLPSCRHCRLFFHQFFAAEILHGDLVTGRCRQPVAEFSAVFPPAHLNRTVGRRERAFAPVELQVGEPELN